MFVMKATREQIVRFLPQGSVGAEIGVAEGDFSKVLLEATRPRRLHLIDPWLRQDDAVYAADPNNVLAAEADRRHDAVRARFAPAVAAGQVAIHRAFSHDVAGDFADGSLDWIYIDGAHHFDAVAADLRLYAPKVKPGGLILGHDYAANPGARAMNFGVVEAVNRFVAEGLGEFLLLTHEDFPTYVLAKPPASDEARRLVGAVLHYHDILVEIRRPETRRFEQYLATVTDEAGAPVRQQVVFAFE
jgi:Methyltransferase domain